MRGEPAFHVLPDAEALARAAAGRILGAVRERLAARSRKGGKGGPAHVALSGGATPRRAFAMLAAPPYAGLFPWDDTHFWQVDERWLPPGHPDGNRRMLLELLLSRVPVPKRNLHFVDTTLPTPSEGARAYESEMRRLLPAGRGGFPVFDLVHLGIGTDGHVGSLFPGSPALGERVAWAAVAEGGVPPIARVTLTPPVIDAAANVLFVVSGRGKAAALERAVAGGNTPAGRVSPVDGTLTFLADPAAAGEAP